MSDWTIFIPSRARARASLQLTARSLPSALRENAFFVVHEQQKTHYERLDLLHVLGTPMAGIEKVRKWILETSPTDKVLMFDDDLRWYKRPDMNSATLVKAEGDDLVKMVERIDTLLENHAHVGVSAREGNNRWSPADPAYIRDGGVNRINTRMLRVLCFRRDIVLDVAKFGRVAVMEDFDLSLQLLRAGYPNRVLWDYAQNQTGTNTSGGCSTYRTHAVQESSARTLAALHPDFVKLRKKENKTGGEFGNRTEVTIYWKKAAASAKKVMSCT